MKKKKKLISTIIRMLFLCICSLIIGVKVYCWNARSLVRNPLPMPMGYGMSVILSGSMEPTYSVNDLVIIKKESDYAKGDVVVYQSGSQMILHRIVVEGQEAVITKGDANNTEDDPVSISDIRGKVVMRVPKVGHIVEFFQSTQGFLIVVILAVVLFELPYYREKKKDLEEQERIKEEIRRLRGERQEGK